MKKLLTLAALALLLVFSGCKREDSENVNQDTIWTLYELFYNTNDGKTYARATFRFSNAFGTKLELSDGAEVRFNGTLIPWQNALAYYELDIAGNAEEGTFEYTDLDGNTYTNSVSIPMIDFPEDLDSIPRDTAHEMFWLGTALEEYESVSLWVDGDNEGDAKVFIENDLGAESIILGVNQLEDLPQGFADFYMDRSYVPPLVEKTGAGGIISGRFRPENIEVYLE